MKLAIVIILAIVILGVAAYAVMADDLQPQAYLPLIQEDAAHYDDPHDYAKCWEWLWKPPWCLMEGG